MARVHEVVGGGGGVIEGLTNPGSRSHGGKGGVTGSSAVAEAVERRIATQSTPPHRLNEAFGHPNTAETTQSENRGEDGVDQRGEGVEWGRGGVCG